MSLPSDPSTQTSDGAAAGESFGDGNPREGSREIHDGIIVSEAMDWCRKDGAVVPYRLWAKQVQAGDLANSVRQTDDRSHVKSSIVLVSHGDAPGAFGIHSGTHNAECTPMTWSATVRAEGRNMVRHDDLWWMNHRNTYGRLTYVKDRNSYPTPDPQLVQAWMQVAGGQAPGTATDAPVPGAGSAATSASSDTRSASAGTMVLPAAGGAAALGGEGGSMLGTIGRGAAWAVEGIGVGTLALAGGFLMLMTTSTAKDDTVRVSRTTDEKKCPPCRTIKGTLGPVGTIGYRPLDVIPMNEKQHGVFGSHHNLFKCGQYPYPKCDCFWAKQKNVATPGNLPPGSIPIEPFRYEAHLHYPDGTEVKCGDYVQVEGDWHGIIVVDADSKESIPPFDAVHIETIGSGIMIKTKEMGLVVYYEFEPSLKLISRTERS